MTIHFIVPGDYGQNTGGYIYNRKISEQLTALGFAVQQHNPGSDFPFPSKLSIKNLASIISSFSSTDIVIIDSLAIAALAEISAFDHFSNPSIALIHLPLFKNPGFTQQQQEYFKAKENWAYRNFDVLVTTSIHTQFTLQEFPGSKLTSTAIQPGTSSIGVIKNQYPTTPKKLLCVANYTPNKGHIQLLKLANELLDIDFTISCYGSFGLDKSFSEKLIEEVKHLGLVNKFILNDSLNFNDLQNEYHNYDMLLSATDYETYGMVFAEAISKGLPIMAPRIGGIPETIAHGGGVLYWPNTLSELKTCLLSLLQSPINYGKLTDEVKIAVNKSRSWDSVGIQFQEIINQLKINQLNNPSSIAG